MTYRVVVLHPVPLATECTSRNGVGISGGDEIDDSQARLTGTRDVIVYSD